MISAELLSRVRAQQRRWLVTGGAGFIGSHLVETLLSLDQEVVLLDDFSLGSEANLDSVSATVGKERWQQCRVVRGDIRDAATCRNALTGCAIVLHQAALGSVPRSIEDPANSFSVNVVGSAALIKAAVQSPTVQHVVYASSSSVYGDSNVDEKRESDPLAPRSPYAVSKMAMEGCIESVVASTPGALRGVVGLRYFNVFGPRQNPRGDYAAVIPRWCAALARGESGVVFGDGTSSRDFTYVTNVVDANLRAALYEGPPVVLNVAGGEELSLRELYSILSQEIRGVVGEPLFGPPRPGDVKRSKASLDAIGATLGYRPIVTSRDGLRATVRSFGKA